MLMYYIASLIQDWFKPSNLKRMVSMSTTS